MRTALAAAATLLLAACAEFGFLAPGQDLEFELAGRIAVKYRDEAASGNLAWRHRARGDELLITSPLGQGIARIVREGDEVTLTTAEAREFRAADAESLTEQVLGFRLPLAGLADWVRARPAPGPVQARYDAAGRLTELEQSGWRVEYLDWSGALPSRLRLTYPGLELRLAISEWK
ncbi:MAG: lipoprotein insertase outer membrane protein LolB [Burkholderiales bacterium]